MVMEPQGCVSGGGMMKTFAGFFFGFGVIVSLLV
jgi:hypothetical protein